MLKSEHIERSDNLRIPQDRKQAAAFIELMKGIENGTAIVRVIGDGYVAAPHRDPEVGDIAAYKSIAGDIYAARVVRVRAPGLVDIDLIDVPGSPEKMRLTKVKYLMEARK